MREFSFDGAEFLKGIAEEQEAKAKQVEAFRETKNILDRLITAGFTEAQAMKFIAAIVTAQGRNNT